MTLMTRQSPVGVGRSNDNPMVGIEIYRFEKDSIREPLSVGGVQISGVILPNECPGAASRVRCSFRNSIGKSSQAVSEEHFMSVRFSKSTRRAKRQRPDHPE